MLKENMVLGEAMYVIKIINFIYIKVIAYYLITFLTNIIMSFSS